MSNSGITWANVTIKLGDLQPWADNPRMSTKAQARRILASFEQFGQVETIAVGPAGESGLHPVYNGHQRLSALLTIHGKDYSVDARRASRALSDEERRKLTVYLHAGAVGSWNWDDLSGWDAAQLGDWGMDKETLEGWRRDTAALTQMVESEQPEQNMIPEDERYKQQYGVVVMCDDEAMQERVYNELLGKGYECKVVVT